MENLETYFAEYYVSYDDDPHVKNLVQIARKVLDVGCGDNLFKKYIQTGSFIGLDPFNKNADVMCDILDYNTDTKFDLIICFGSINFYDISWVDARMQKVFSLLTKNGRICMKVNPNQPFGDGTRLEWFDSWTMGLVNHYAHQFKCDIENYREVEHGRFKWDYVTR
jgi:hypothetical protein